MSILIKGMEMPKRCVDCWIMDGDDCMCCASRGRYLSPDYRYGIKDKPEWCPLVSVPEHGEMEEVPSAQPTHDDGFNALDALDCDARRNTMKTYKLNQEVETYNMLYKCPKCGDVNFVLPRWRYCPNCGCAMKGEDDETD